jgi:two-component system NtrC family sensor kinase
LRTLIIGGGRGCVAVLDLLEQGKLGSLSPQIVAVADIDPAAPGMQIARRRGWLALPDLEAGLALEKLELVLELTGSEDVLTRVRHGLPPGVRLVDHVIAGLFWDLERMNRALSEQLREQQELKARMAGDRAELQEILDTIPDAVMVVDPDLRVLRVNRRFEELTGESRQAVAGRGCRQIQCDAGELCSAITNASPLEQVLRSGSAATLTQSSSDPDEGTVFQLTVNPVVDAAGRVTRVVQTARDITERVRLERETERWALRFRQIVDAVHGIVTIKDLSGRYQLVNPWAERVFRMREQEMIGHTAGELFAAKVAHVIEANDRVVLDRQGHHTVEETLEIESVPRIVVSERFPLADQSGRIVSICCVARDETQARQLQHDLIQTERLTAVGRLAAGVAHELNNPLTGILTFAEDLLEQSAAGDPLREDYQLIIDEALRCRRIVKDLLDYSRNREAERRRARLDDVVRRAVGMVERQASFRNVRMRMDVEPDLPLVDIDPAQVQQVILNLVMNARDAMSGFGEIRIRATPSPDRESAVLSVTDTGCGIPPDQLAEVFEPFFSTKGEQGNGLGLAIVQSVVERHGGEVHVDSVVGKGTTFRVSLPAAENQSRSEMP